MRVSTFTRQTSFGHMYLFATEAQNVGCNTGIIVIIFLASFLIRPLFINVTVGLIFLSGLSPDSVVNFDQFEQYQEARQRLRRRRRDIPTFIYLIGADSDTFDSAIGRSLGSLRGQIRATYSRSAILGDRQSWDLHVYHLTTGELINPSRYRAIHLTSDRLVTGLVNPTRDNQRNIVPLEQTR